MCGVVSVDSVDSFEIRVLSEIGLVVGRFDVVAFCKVALEFFWKSTDPGNAFRNTALSLTKS